MLDHIAKEKWPYIILGLQSFQRFIQNIYNITRLKIYLCFELLDEWDFAPETFKNRHARDLSEGNRSSMSQLPLTHDTHLIKSRNNIHKRSPACSCRRNQDDDVQWFARWGQTAQFPVTGVKLFSACSKAKRVTVILAGSLYARFLAVLRLKHGTTVLCNNGNQNFEARRTCTMYNCTKAQLKCLKKTGDTVYALHSPRPLFFLFESINHPNASCRQ